MKKDPVGIVVFSLFSASAKQALIESTAWWEGGEDGGGGTSMGVGRKGLQLKLIAKIYFDQQ